MRSRPSSFYRLSASALFLQGIVVAACTGDDDIYATPKVPPVANDGSTPSSSSGGSGSSSSGSTGTTDAANDGANDAGDGSVDGSTDAADTGVDTGVDSGPVVCTAVACASDVTCTALGCGTCNMGQGKCKNP
jgi:hypothetical protein